MNNQVNVGLVGLGYWGPKVLNNINNHPGFSLVAVADNDPVRQEWSRQQNGGITVFKDGKELIHSKEIDAVVIATPVETHEELAAEALKAGKHVWLEKPMTPTVEAGQNLTKLATDSGKTTLVGHLYLYHAGIQAIADVLNGNTFGSLSFGKCFSMQMEWNNQRPPKSRFDVVDDLGPHALSIMVGLFGKPKFVSAVGKAYLPTGNHWLHDDVTAIFQWEDGKTASLRLGWHSPRKVRNITIYGEGGKIIFDEVNEMKAGEITRSVIWYAPGWTAAYVTRKQQLLMPIRKVRSYCLTRNRDGRWNGKPMPSTRRLPKENNR